MVNPAGKRNEVVSTYRGVPIEYDGGGYVVKMQGTGGGNLYIPRAKTLASARKLIGRALAKGATVKKNPRRRARKAVASRRRRSATRSRSTTKRKSRVPAWVRAKGFSSWSSYMESIRPGGTVARKRRRNAPKSRRRRRRNPVAVTRANPRRRRRRIRSS
jgi:hypothetical protein